MWATSCRHEGGTVAKRKTDKSLNMKSKFSLPLHLLATFVAFHLGSALEFRPLAVWNGADAVSVALTPEHVYIASGTNGVIVLEIDDSGLLRETCRVATASWASGVAVSGQHLYLADWSAGLRVFSVTNPACPVLVGEYDTPGWAQDVAISGGHLFLANFREGVFVFDINNPGSPSLLNQIDTQGVVREVAITGARLLVADWSLPNFVNGVTVYYPIGEGMILYDLRDHADPVRLGTFQSAHGVSSVDGSGAVACAVDGGGIMHIVDVSNPASPVEFASLGGKSFDVALLGVYAYVTGPQGLTVLDLTVPSSPRVVAQSIHDTAQSVSVGGGWIATAARGGVISLYRPAPPLLRIQAVGEQISLAWPASATAEGYKLQTAPATAGPWREFAGSLTNVGNDHAVVIDSRGSACFFRLCR